MPISRKQFNQLGETRDTPVSRRQQLITFLKDHQDRAYYQAELGRTLGEPWSRPMVSKYVQQLEERGLVRTRQKGRKKYVLWRREDQQ